MFKNDKRFQIRIIILAPVWFFGLYMFCVAVNEKESGIFYILMWTDRRYKPFVYWPPGRKLLILMNCEFQNCHFTSNKKYFRNLTDYDVILFNAPNIHGNMILPQTRSEEQIYVFVGVKPSRNFPISRDFDNFFNYTWSYKLNSDILYPYFFVRNRFDGQLIGPQTSLWWRNHNSMKPTPEYVVKYLQNKSICAAWFVSNCHATKERIKYYQSLQAELLKFDQMISIFSTCNPNSRCFRIDVDQCFHSFLPDANYYFYLSFEHTFNDDYVTDDVVTAINNYAIPVVFGGANYSRFLPDGAYLNVRDYTAKTLAIKMNQIIRNRQEYYDYFRFHRYYIYHKKGETGDTEPLCILCKFINRDSIRKDRRVYPRFSYWWNSNKAITNMIGDLRNYTMSV